MTRKKMKEIKKTVLLVLFIPSKERDGKTPINQIFWRDKALEMLGNLFGGGTAFPKGKGVWRDDERDRQLVFDEPIVMHCYTQKKEIESLQTLFALKSFCKKMGREANQGEVGLVVADEYLAIQDFSNEEKST